MFQAAKFAIGVALGLALTSCIAQVPGSDVTDDTAAAQQQELKRVRVQLCNPRRCGPQLGLPNTLCPDGVTVAGPSGRCIRQPHGSCGWEVISCPATACPSSASCAAGEYCTVEDGDCNHAPGCIPGGVCTDLCYGVCKPKPACIQNVLCVIGSHFDNDPTVCACVRD